MSSDISHNENLNNYKGIHYENQEKETYYECGAHFSFKEVCRKLTKLINQQKQEEISDSKSKKKFSNYNQTSYNEFTNMHLKEKADRVLTSFANKTILNNKISRNKNINVNDPKSRNITANIFKYSSEANNDSKNVYEKYNKKKVQTETENMPNNTQDVILKEQILKNFLLNSDKNSSSKNKISEKKTRNKPKNLQLYLTYSNKYEIQHKRMKDSNTNKDQFYNINTVKINLNKLQSKNEKMNIYMSYDMSKLAKRNEENEQGMKSYKLSQSLFKKNKPRSSSSRKDYTEENWIKTTFNKKDSDSVGRDNSSKHYSELDSLSKKKPFLCFSNLKTKVLSRNIRPINPTITLENDLNNNNSLPGIYRSISNKKSEISPNKKFNFLKSSYYLNTTANKSQNKSSINKTNQSEKSKNYDSILFKKSNSDHLNFKKPNPKDKKNDSQMINLDKKNYMHIYNFKNDLNALLAKSNNYSKDKSTCKNSDSYYRVNSSSLGNCNVSSEVSLINLGEKNLRNYSNASKNIKKNSDAAADHQNYNHSYLNTINSVKFEEGQGKEKKNNNNNNNYNNYKNYKFNFAPPSIPPKKDGSFYKDTIANKMNFNLNENTKRKLMNTSFSKKNTNKINFSNQNLDYKNMKGEFNLINKKSPNSNFKVFSQNIIDINNLKREANPNLSEFNVHNKTEIKEPRTNLKKDLNSSNFSNKKNNQSGFSTIKKIKFNVNNSNEYANNQLNSENSLGLFNNSVIQTQSNLSSNNPYLETKYTYNANKTNAAYVNTHQNNKSGNTDNAFNKKTPAYKNYNILNLSPKKGQKIKLLNNIKKKENIINEINNIIIKENKSSLTNKKAPVCYLNKSTAIRNGGMHNFKFVNNPEKKHL